MSSDTDPVLQLGRDLADALDPSDIVGRWMSHHLAQLISQCDENPHDAELPLPRETLYWSFGNTNPARPLGANHTHTYDPSCARSKDSTRARAHGRTTAHLMNKHRASKPWQHTRSCRWHATSIGRSGS